MGEWKIQVPLKLDAEIVERMDRDVQRFAPFCEGRSAIGRELIRYAYDLIDEGIIEWSLEAVQIVRGNRRIRDTRTNRQSVPSIPRGVAPETRDAGKRKT